MPDVQGNAVAATSGTCPMDIGTTQQGNGPVVGATVDHPPVHNAAGHSGVQHGSVQQMKETITNAHGASTSNGGNQCESRRISTADIQRVQNLIERCLQLYMPRKEVVQTLQAQAKIEPSFTNLVWQKLEEQNPDFFRAYYTRLKLKDQIIMFNYLLEQQVQMVQKLHMNWLQALPSLMARPGLPMPAMPSMPLGVNGMLVNNGAPQFPSFNMPQNLSSTGMPGQMMLPGMPLNPPTLEQVAPGFGHSHHNNVNASQLGGDMLTAGLNDSGLDGNTGVELHMLSGGLQEGADDLMAGLGNLSSLQGGGNDSHGFNTSLGMDNNNSDLPNLPKSFSFSDFGGLDLATHITEDGDAELVDLDTGEDDALPDFALGDMGQLDFDALGKA